MGNGVIAFFAAASAMAWIYSKMMRKTGQNMQTSIIVVAISGVLIFLVAYFALGFVLSGK